MTIGSLMLNENTKGVLNNRLFGMFDREKMQKLFDIIPRVIRTKDDVDTTPLLQYYLIRIGLNTSDLLKYVSLRAATFIQSHDSLL